MKLSSVPLRIRAGELAPARECLLPLNRALVDPDAFVSGAGVSRVAIAIDGTWSMGNELKAVFDYIVVVINLIRETIGAHGHDSNSFLIKFLIYRNYGDCAVDDTLVHLCVAAGSAIDEGTSFPPNALTAVCSPRPSRWRCNK